MRIRGEGRCNLGSRFAAAVTAFGMIAGARAATPPKPHSLTDIKKILKALEEERFQAPLPAAEPPGPPDPQRGERKNPFQPRTRALPETVAVATNGGVEQFNYVDDRPSFDLPVTYNRSVRNWINHFQNGGRKWFKTWLERSHRYLPLMTETLGKKGLPQDLAYVAMIESGFSSKATSDAQAVGYWQFIESTANRYGLRTTWWLDERRDFTKSTIAAASYLGDLYRLFGSWYLAAAAYNMGEGRMKRLVQKYKTTNYWELSRQKDFPNETREYIPKLIAAMLIAKAPGLYGFTNLSPLESYSYEYYQVPGGTDLHALARHMGLDRKVLLKLNPELIRGYIPKDVSGHRIRVPRGYVAKMSQYLRAQL